MITLQAPAGFVPDDQNSQQPFLCAEITHQNNLIGAMHREIAPIKCVILRDATTLALQQVAYSTYIC